MGTLFSIRVYLEYLSLDYLNIFIGMCVHIKLIFIATVVLGEMLVKSLYSIRIIRN